MEVKKTTAIEALMEAIIPTISKVKVGEKECVCPVPQVVIEKPVKRGISLLIPTTRYVGHGKYCYPLETGIIGKYNWECD